MPLLFTSFIKTYINKVVLKERWWYGSGMYCTFWVLHDLPEILLIVGDINDSDILNVFQTSGRRNIECNVRPKFHCCTQFNSLSLLGTFTLAT